LMICIFLAIEGSGKWSLDAAVKKKKAVFNVAHAAIS